MGMPRWFEESLEQSRIKAEIVTKYFWSWANIMKGRSRSGRIAYIDLFAGPGRYKDGTQSTPLMVLRQAIGRNDICRCLVSIFNDADSRCVSTLEDAIRALDGIEKLKYYPKVHNAEVGTEIVEMFESMRLVPTFFFVDPWGYKGLSLRLINSVLKNWGCDCVFFFNYNRINMGINNPKVVAHMNALFGQERADYLREVLDDKDPFDREMMIVNELALALKDLGGEYVLPFCFKNERGERTSHHLVFVSKDSLGYGIMKDIMANYSTDNSQGVPSFTYNPVTNRQYSFLYEFARPLDDLEGMLLDKFGGKTMTMVDVYENHHVGLPFIKRNYKDVLRIMEEKALLEADPPAELRRIIKGVVTFADSVIVTFKKNG